MSRGKKHKKLIGRTVGKWKLTQWIGAGGNGHVWRCTDVDGNEAAIKFLKSIQRKAYARFVSEVEVIQRNSDIPGVLPILDKYLPEPGFGQPYYVMPLATPLYKMGLSWDLETRVDVVREIAQVVAHLHARDITHRDIKPSNVLHYNGRYYLADFGLAHFPEKLPVSDPSEEIGARWTIAPEMRRESELADHKKADVYSLAKTLWILLTRKDKGFEGQYTIDSSIELRRFYPQTFTDPIDQLLSKCTDLEPDRRPVVEEFIATLEEWKRLNGDFHEQNKRRWLGVQQRLFPGFAPHRATWTNVDEIQRVLQLVASYENGNHLFFPDGGGLDVKDVKRSFEEGCLELRCGRIEIVRPKQLTFESLGDPTWNYFYLELDALSPSPEVDEDAERCRTEHKEVLSELAPGQYHGYDVIEKPWKYSARYFAAREPRRVVRWFGGNMLIVCKRSAYNLDHTTYDARHHKMGRDGFRGYMERSLAHSAWKSGFAGGAAHERPSLVSLEKVIQNINDSTLLRCSQCGIVMNDSGAPYPAESQTHLAMIYDAFGGFSGDCTECWNKRHMVREKRTSNRQRA